MRPLLCLLAGVLPLSAAEPDPPPLSDLERFPDAILTRSWVKFQEEHSAWLRCQRDLDLVYREFWQSRFDDADARRVAWDNLRAAQIASQWVGEGRVDGVWVMAYQERYTRACLAKLRDRLGPEAWQAGRMPAPYPVPYMRYFRERP